MRGKPITEAEGNQILRALAEAVAETHEDHPAPAVLLRNPQELDRYIRQVKVDWHTIASGLSMEKGKVYTWYFNTWSNKVLGARMTPTDKEIIRSEIRRAIQEGTPIDKEFRKNIYNKLSTTYHTLEVSCHVTNYINSREAKALMEQCHFYVEKLSKHRAATTGGPVMDTTITHHPIVPQTALPTHEFDAQQQSSLAATGLGSYKTRPDDTCRYAQPSCDAGVGDSDGDNDDDDDNNNNNDDDDNNSRDNNDSRDDDNENDNSRDSRDSRDSRHDVADDDDVIDIDDDDREPFRKSRD